MAKYLTNIDLSHNALLNAAMQPLASAPSSPVTGQVYFDTGLGQFGVWNGSSWAYMGSGGGTVTTASVVSTNGFAGTVANATTTPAITLTTSITGVLKGNGTAISAAAAGTDYLAPSGNGSALTGLTQSQVSGLTSALALLAPLAGPTFTGTVTVPTPSSSGAAATKGYVDGVAQGLPNKYSAVAATLGTETFTIASGSVTQISGTTLNGQSPAVNDYVLVKDAPASTGTGSAGSSQPGNGLYIVTSNTTNLSLSRATAMSGSNGPAGSFVFIEGGTQANNGYAVATPSTSAAFTYGTGNIAWTQFTGAGEITAGTGLSKSGNTLSVIASTVHKFAATIGDGSSTSIAVTHSLGTTDIIAQVYDASTGVLYGCDVTATSTSVATFGFAVAPSTNALRVVIMA